MTIGDATREYVKYKQALGQRFETEEVILRAFTKRIGRRTVVSKITAKQVLGYLGSQGKVTRFWHRKHDALSGFWVFCIQREWTDRSPLPVVRPAYPPRFVPHIYSQEELRALLEGTTTYQQKLVKLEPVTLRTLLLLLYGAGLRVSEPIALCCSDVDFVENTLLIRETKFYKSRRVALSSQLAMVMRDYDASRVRAGHSRHADAPFFTYKNGETVARFVVEDAFLRLRQHVSVSRRNARYQPRLHDLRHTFAVHRVLAWYRNGQDVQRLLPGLATHLGHINLASTQWYLTMTPELLAEASTRFGSYAAEVINARA